MARPLNSPGPPIARRARQFCGYYREVLKRMPEVKVSLVGCEDYQRERVRESVRRALELLGGPESIVPAGETVFLKVNAVVAADPGCARTTNPEVVRAVAEEFSRVTDRVLIGDSPGGPFNRNLLKRVYERTGYARVAKETGARLALDTETIDVEFPGGKAVKRLTLCRSMLEADRLVSISKLKTHSLLNVTGPIKNLFGAVPGMTKFVYHSRFEDPEDFADLVVDVHMAARPAFHIVDAVDVIDGDGSRRGRIRRMGAIAAGIDAFALELLMMRLSGVDGALSLTLRAAAKRGFCSLDAGSLDILGDDMEEFALDDFRLPERNRFSERIPARLAGRLNRLASLRPRPLEGRCTACGRCEEFCPRRAISVRGGTARVDLKSCIRCFCCSELCEYDAIELERPAMLRRTGGLAERT